MGMDVYGEKPSGPKGEYFRNNVWWWRPLWAYVCEECGDVLSAGDQDAGQYNDGHLIDAEKAHKIAERLLVACQSGKVLDAEKAHKERLDALPDEVCSICEGSGTRADMVVANGCNKCLGKGKVRPPETHYPFSAENVLEFAEFVKESGGFRIS